MLNWLPQPTEFAQRLREAVGVDPAHRLQRLVTLAGLRLNFLETIQLDRAVRNLDASLARTLPAHRLALLGSTTLEHLAPAARVAGLRRKLRIDVHCGAFGQFRQEILEPPASLREFAPQTLVLSLAAAHVVPEISLAAPATEVDTRLRQVVADLSTLWRHARQQLGATVIQQTFLNVAEPLFGSFDRNVPGSPDRVVARLNELLAEAAAAEGVALLDIARASERDGRDTWFDATRMLQAKQEIAPQAAPLFGELLTRIVAAQRGASKKCLVMDLDNTLWGGVLGDDGVQGLVLGPGSGVGEAYLGVQQYARLLKERGIMLAVCSKNDPQLAEEAFSSHPEMLLKRSDIAVFVANWDDKARNLVSVAERLNIGLDSLVFLDDNPAERARVREALTEVAVPELPDDVTGYVRCLADAGYFEAVAFTADDRQRAASYAQNAERDALRASVQSIDQYLQGLAMELSAQPFAAVDLPRVTQLINKTNQFNPTTHRYSPDEIARHLATPGALSLQFRLADRFGDNGLVSALLLLPVRGERHCLEIDTWVMSCRVFGRQLEHEAMNVAVESARHAGVQTLVASYVPTPRNAVVSELYAQLGFERVACASHSQEGTRWLLDLRHYQPFVTHIARKVEHP
jgi:FkbH-like protein